MTADKTVYCRNHMYISWHKYGTKYAPLATCTNSIYVLYLRGVLLCLCCGLRCGLAPSVPSSAINAYNKYIFPLYIFMSSLSPQLFAVSATIVFASVLQYFTMACPFVRIPVLADVCFLFLLMFVSTMRMFSFRYVCLNDRIVCGFFWIVWTYCSWTLWIHSMIHMIHVVTLNLQVWVWVRREEWERVWGMLRRENEAWTRNFSLNRYI